MKMKNHFIQSKNSDNTITIYDFEENCFYNLNQTASIIFENIEIEIDCIVEKIVSKFDAEITIVYKDVQNTLNQLKESFFN